MILALLLTLAFPAEAKIERDRGVIRQFMRVNPCPWGPDAGSTKRCRGAEVDHRLPKCFFPAGDVLPNLQWLTIEAHDRKTRADLVLCRTMREAK